MPACPPWNGRAKYKFASEWNRFIENQQFSCNRRSHEGRVQLGAPSGSCLLQGLAGPSMRHEREVAPLSFFAIAVFQH